MDTLKLIDFSYDWDKSTFSLVLNLWVLLLIIALFFTARYLIKKYIKSGKVHKDIVPVKMKYKIGGAEFEYQIIRNYQNVEVAHRIYIELVTRKAAIKIDTEHDVISEVYNSWYSLFNTTREELKSLSGEIILNNDVSNDLIELLTDILNKGLRPHLTTYQAKFRKWYAQELEKNKETSLSPQKIQTKYEDYDDLIKSMSEVNDILIGYSKQLRILIGRDKKGT